MGLSEERGYLEIAILVEKIMLFHDANMAKLVAYLVMVLFARTFRMSAWLTPSTSDGYEWLQSARQDGYSWFACRDSSHDLEQDEPVHTQESPANGSNAASEGSNAIIEIRPAKPFCVAFSF